MNYNNGNTLKFLAITLILLWCTVRYSYCLTQLDGESDQNDYGRLEENDSEDDNNEYKFDRRASLRHHQQQLMLSRRASLRPAIVQRASLRPHGKRASLRPTFMGKRKRRAVDLYSMNDV